MFEYEIEGLEPGEYDVVLSTEWQGDTFVRFEVDVSLSDDESCSYEFAESHHAGCG